MHITIVCNLISYTLLSYEVAYGNVTAKENCNIANTAVEIRYILNTIRIENKITTKAFQHREEKHALTVKDLE